MGFLPAFYRITFVPQDFPSPPGYLGYLRVPKPSCQWPVHQDFPSPPGHLGYLRVPITPGFQDLPRRLGAYGTWAYLLPLGFRISLAAWVPRVPKGTYHLWV